MKEVLIVIPKFIEGDTFKIQIDKVHIYEVTARDNRHESLMRDIMKEILKDLHFYEISVEFIIDGTRYRPHINYTLN